MAALIGMLAGTLAGCAGAPVTPLDCGGRRIDARVDGDRVTLDEGGKHFVLHRVTTASGSRYEAPGDAGTFVWFKGEGATVSMLGAALPACTAAR